MILAAVLSAVVSVTPVYTNHNRVSGYTPTMTNIQQWAEAVTNAIYECGRGGGESTSTNAVNALIDAAFEGGTQAVNQVIGSFGIVSNAAMWASNVTEKSVRVNSTNDVGRAFKLTAPSYGTLIESNYATRNAQPRQWYFHGIADECKGVKDGTTSITVDEDDRLLFWFTYKFGGFGLPTRSWLRLDDSAIVTSNMLNTALGGYLPTSWTNDSSFIDKSVADTTSVFATNLMYVATNGLVTSADYTKQYAALTNDNANTRAIVYSWENFLDGSNVVFAITNFISGTYRLDEAKLRILELTNGVYREVYNSRDEITLHIHNFQTNVFDSATNDIVKATEDAIAGVDGRKADKAWGQYTSAGGIAPSNVVYMTAPHTVFAGGMEYERVAVGEGAVCVLTTKGAPVWTQGDEGTFKFQDDGGTNFFGFAKTDSYVIGCNTDGIAVSNHIVMLLYEVTMSGVPCIWYVPDLNPSNSWERLNTSDGQPVPGASHLVSWEMNPNPGTEVCYINCQEAQGFFKATIETVGTAKFMTNMPADFGGGILCTDGVHKVSIDWNNGSPRFVEVQ